MMDDEKKKMLKESLEIIKKYSNEEDSAIISALLNNFDSKQLDEELFNEIVHNYYLPKDNSRNFELEKSNERNVG